GGETASWDLSFPNFESDPPKFPHGRDDYPFLDLILSGRAVPAEGGTMVITWMAESCDLVVKAGPADDPTVTLASDQEPTAVLVVPAAGAGAGGAPDHAEGSSLGRWIRYGFEHILPGGM